MKNSLVVLAICPFLAVPAFAQTPAAPATGTGEKPAAAPTAKPAPAPQPLFSAGGFNFSAQVRSRVESFDWFGVPDAGIDGKYVFNGTQLRLNGLKSTPKYDIGFDLQQVVLIGLPDNAVAPAPRGALGLGANYYTANGEQDGALSIKQAYLRLKNAVGKGSSARVGRFEFNDGLEVASKDATLNWLKTQRISQRLIGTFGFSHVGRSFDGAHLTAPVGTKGDNFTGVAARPTEGVFQLEANDNIDAVNFLYGAYTKPMKNSEARIFGMAYEDGRESPKSIKTDNRPLPIRTADSEDIKVYTLGANYEGVFDTGGGKFDVLAWGALQGGDWGALDHKGNALALEAGYQPKDMKLKPWFRVGYYQSSGDGNNADGKHETFFTPLPTPRIYSRYPFYNQMNNKDLFFETILRPNPKLNLRGSFHKLDLSEASDLWYVGGGAFQDTGFGTSGRPSGGSKSLANLIDISADYNINPTTSIGVYAAKAMGKDVIENIYTDKNSTYGYLEFTKKF